MAPPQLASEGFGGSKSGGTEENVLARLRWRARRRVDLVVGHCRVGGHRFDPRNATTPVLDPEIRRLERLRDDQALLSKAAQQLSFP